LADFDPVPAALPVQGSEAYNIFEMQTERKASQPMKKNNWTLVLFLLIGLIAGTIVGNLLAQVHGLSALTQSASISWQPKADLQVVKYDLNLQVKLNIVSLLGLLGGFWLYKKM
jgi:uncharacterized protein YneF (UPF0154 family)